MNDFSDLVIRMMIINRITVLNEEINRININMNIKKEKELYKPIPKKIQISYKCVTCSKLFYGYRNKMRLIQHCNSTNHKYS